MIRTFIIFGASGDLTSRYLLPTLAHLHHAGLLPAGLKVLGLAMENWDTEFFKHRIGEELARFAQQVPEAARQAVIAKLDYRKADVTVPGEVASGLAPLRESAALYLALPPAVLLPAAQSIIAAGVPQGSHIVVEKPFGVDLESTHELNKLLHKTFSEQNIFRMDHFLGKQTVQNIVGLRFANRIFEPLWNCHHIERIEITWDETLTVQGRVGGFLRCLARGMTNTLCLRAPHVFREEMCY
jgi:glucose-6-phosphate 1-dehydrogenase